MIDKKIYVCQNCINKYYNSPDPNDLSLPFYSSYLNDPDFCKDKCALCGSTNMIQILLTQSEYETITRVSTNIDFVLAMDNLKESNLIEFYSKLAFFKLIPKQEKDTGDIPKCPTCGSTNVKRISAAERYVGTGLVGLASSNVGHTMQCNNCGYKW